MAEAGVLDQIPISITDVRARLHPTILGGSVDREHIVQLSSREVLTFRAWLPAPNGSLTLGRATFEAVAGGGILVRTRPFRAPLSTTDDTPVIEVCPSRMLGNDGTEIRHCLGAHQGPGGFSPDHADGRAWRWSEAGAMPAGRPCDKRCGQCVERTRDAVLTAALEWRGFPMAEDARLCEAIDEYRKVMGL